MVFLVNLGKAATPRPKEKMIPLSDGDEEKGKQEVGGCQRQDRTVYIFNEDLHEIHNVDRVH